MATTNDKKSDESRQNSTSASASPRIPSEDLDQYGVWVKAGPVTVDEESSDLEGFELSDIAEESGELTSEEEELLGSLETEQKEMSSDGLEAEETEKIEEESLDLNFDDESSLELPEEESTEQAFDKETAPEDKGGEEDLDLDFNLEDEDLDIKAQDEDDLGVENITLPTADEDLSDIDMEDIEQSKDEELPELEIDEEHLSTPEIQLEEQESETRDTKVEPVAGEEEAETQAEGPQQGDEPVEFSDIEAVEREMTEPVKSSASGSSYDILAKIEAELASIKAELSELKRELSGLRPAGAAVSAVETEEAAKTKEEEKTGFFDEDEDETIALTGDELDNILNTADITEEKGESDVLPEEFDLGPIETEDKALGEQDDIISLEEPAPVAEDIPVTTPEEQAIIEEYNRELDKFGEEEITVDEEDAIDGTAVEALPDEKEDLLGIETSQVPETIVAEVPKMEDTPPLEEIILEEAPAAPEEKAEAVEEMLLEEKAEEPALEKQAEEEIEFDLDALDQTAVEEEAIEEEAPAFEEELEEMEISIPEEEPAAESLPEISATEEAPSQEAALEPKAESPATEESAIPENLRDEIRSVLKYMDQLLESLPEEKIQEFAKSEHFEVYRRLFEELELE